MTTIYALTHPETGVVRYFGKTRRNLRDRLRRHIRDARSGRNHRCNWIRSLSSPPAIVPVLTTEDRYASAAERFAIALYRAAGDDLVNATAGGDGGNGSSANRGKTRSPEQREALSAAKKGKKQSPEHSAAIGAAHKGKKHSPEWNLAVRAGMLGKKYPLERCAAISAGKLGKKHSPERRAAQSARQLGKKLSPEHGAATSAGKKGKGQPWSPKRRAAWLLAGPVVARGPRQGVLRRKAEVELMGDRPGHEFRGTSKEKWRDTTRPERDSWWDRTIGALESRKS